MIAIYYIGGSFNTVCPHFLKYERPRTVNYVRYLANHASGRPSCFGWKMAGEVRFRKTISLLHCQTGGLPGEWAHTSKELPNNCLFFINKL